MGTIATEFLLDHLNMKLIGIIKSEKIPPMVAIHENKLVHPMGIFYDEKSNIMILHIITNAKGLEWEIGDTIIDLAKSLDAKEVVAIEGISSMNAGEEETETYYYSNNSEKKKKLSSIGVKPLNEGIIMGTTGPLLLQAGQLPVSCIFAETPSQLPDSKAAAKIIQILDKYLGLKVDYKPLLNQAERVEQKLKGIMAKSKIMEQEKEKKDLSYVG